MIRTFGASQSNASRQGALADLRCKRCAADAWKRRPLGLSVEIYKAKIPGGPNRKMLIRSITAPPNVPPCQRFSCRDNRRTGLVANQKAYFRVCRPALACLGDEVRSMGKISVSDPLPLPVLGYGAD